MSRHFRIALVTASVLSVLSLVALTGSAHAAEPVIRPAVDGILAAFDAHPLVGLGDHHELANQEAFYATLVRDPRFAETVGNVVAEFGASQHQDILDRYLGGEDVPYHELAKVWRNTVAWNPSVMGVGYQTFFAQVRAVNLALPPERRIRVWLSEPPIDWSTIHTKEAWQRIYDDRDRHVADVIVREILDRQKKALVIYGTGHFSSFPWPSTLPLQSGGTDSLRELVERTHADAFFVVTPYVGYEKPGCAAALEAETQWPRQVLITPIRDTPLVDALMRPGCMADTLRGLDPLPPADEVERLLRRFYEIETGVAGDALLYLGPAAELMRAPADPTTWMDVEYRKEIERRIVIRGGTPLPFADIVRFVAIPPIRLRPQ